MINPSTLDKTARIAANSAKTTTPYQDRVEIAWSAIAEMALLDYTAPESHLVQAGKEAIWSAWHQDIQAHGLDRDYQPRPGFTKYWTSVTDAGFAESLIDKLAVSQVLRCLTDAEFTAITALANTDSYAAAAASLGLTEAAFLSRVSRARKRLRAEWFAPETPTAHGTVDKRSNALPRATHCQRGHEFSDENTLFRRNGRRACRACERAGRKKTVTGTTP